MWKDVAAALVVVGDDGAEAAFEICLLKSFYFAERHIYLLFILVK